MLYVFLVVLPFVKNKCWHCIGIAGIHWRQALTDAYSEKKKT